MPVKNTDKYLDACLNSIMEQSYQNWELIAVDDHSTDKSRAILEHYKTNDPKNRITVLSNQGTGIISALRTAYAKAQGNFITRMDSDDIMTPQKLDLFVERLRERGPHHIVTGLVEYFNDETKNVGEGYRKYTIWINSITSNGTNFSDIYKECPIASPNWMVHRSDLDASQAFTPDIYPEDYDLCFRFRQAGLQVTPIKEVTHRWRDYSTRTSRIDDNYKDNRFTALKVKYFITSDYKEEMQLVLWGTGPKGKAIAKELIRNEIPFRWVTDNSKKIGKHIYDILIENYSELVVSSTKAQYIIGVSQRGAQAEIRQSLRSANQHEVYYFC